MTPIFECETCDLVFSTGKALDNHIDEQRAKGVPGHIFCEHCDKWVPSERALAFHCREAHPVDQQLECPACNGGPFKDVATFIGHIEKRSTCPIDLNRLSLMRDQLMTFMRNLSRQRGYKDRRDFSEFICNDSSVVFPVKPVPQDVSWVVPEGQPRPPEWDPTPVDNAWEMTEQQEEAEGRKEVFEGSSNDDFTQPRLLKGPGRQLHPGATTDDCWNPVTKRFNCPNHSCLKSFPTPRSLVAHLKGPTHKDILYKCPGCMKPWKTLESLAAHTTATASSYCKFRRHEGFDSFIDQLTGGLIEVLSERSPDGSHRYQVVSDALERFKKAVPGNVPANAVALVAPVAEPIEETTAKGRIAYTTWEDDKAETSYDNWDPVPTARLNLNTPVARKTWAHKKTPHTAVGHKTREKKSKKSAEEDLLKFEEEKKKDGGNHQRDESTEADSGSDGTEIQASRVVPEPQTTEISSEIRDMNIGFNLLTVTTNDTAWW